MKTAVALLNLGGPDRPESIRPFLYNFFMDKNIIRVPLPLRWLLASLISRRRAKNEAAKAYGLLGGRSPLLENTQAQANALQDEFGPGYKIFVCMRYWHPLAGEVARQVKEYAPDRIVLLPLYPQFSTATTRSSFEDWDRAAIACGLAVPTRKVCCYPLLEGFIAASATNIKTAYDDVLRNTGQKPRVLFSAHGLPEDVIRDGDPYQWQCEISAQAIAAALNIPGLDWQICYQSRVGPKKWIGPSTDEAIRKAGAEGVPVIVYPHAFVSEHVETLVEIEIEYRHLAQEAGVPFFVRAPTVGAMPEFISGLASLAKEKNPSARQCPEAFCRCALA